MINQKLINIINSGDAWAFVGSGCSVNSGLPSWGELLEKAVSLAESSFGPMSNELKEKIQKLHTSGKLCVRNKGQRRGRNASTGSDLMLSARKVATFKCSGKLRDKVNR